MGWRKYEGRELNYSILEELENSIKTEVGKGNKVKVCVGTDSQVYASSVEFATVIVVVVEGNGAFMFVNKSSDSIKYQIKERMLQEVNKSIETAYMISDLCKGLNISLEVHVDINSEPSFPSHTAYKEAMGYIKGMGFTFKAKPDAFASSSCANKLVH